MVHENYERLVYFDGVSSTLSLSPIRLPCCLKAPSSFTLSRPARMLCCLFRTHIQVAHAEGSKRYSFVGYTYVNHLNLFLYSNTAPLSPFDFRKNDGYIHNPNISARTMCHCIVWFNYFSILPNHELMYL